MKKETQCEEPAHSASSKCLNFYQIFSLFLLISLWSDSNPIMINWQGIVSFFFACLCMCIWLSIANQRRPTHEQVRGHKGVDFSLLLYSLSFSCNPQNYPIDGAKVHTLNGIVFKWNRCSTIICHQISFYLLIQSEVIHSCLFITVFFPFAIFLQPQKPGGQTMKEWRN